MEKFPRFALIFGFTNDWNEITEKVRKNLVTGATTHYKESEFEIEKWKREDFYLNNRIVMDNILKDIFKIETISKTRKGKKKLSHSCIILFSRYVPSFRDAESFKEG